MMPFPLGVPVALGWAGSVSPIGVQAGMYEEEPFELGRPVQIKPALGQYEPPPLSREALRTRVPSPPMGPQFWPEGYPPAAFRKANPYPHWRGSWSYFGGVQNVPGLFPPPPFVPAPEHGPRRPLPNERPITLRLPTGGGIPFTGV